MQSGSGQPAVRVADVGIRRRVGRIGALLLGLAVSACVSTGQIVNLTEQAPATIAVESIDGPPAAVVHKFASLLEDEAAARRIAVVPPGEAHYRLRGRLAAQGDEAGAETASIGWALDVYDADGGLIVRLSGEEKTVGRRWTAADDEALNRIARNAMERLADVLAGTRPASRPAVATTPPPRRTPSALGWLDDWTPEASGIFRIFRREPSRPEIADAPAPARRNEVPLPRRRPAPST